MPIKKSKLAVAIMWHQHQPYYKNGSGVYRMPWVRFHGTKDYLDMVMLLREFPDVKQNYNLVPSLLFQIEDYARRDAKDTVWELSEKPADHLTAEEKRQILDKFFIINVNNMIRPYKRYYELYLKYKNLPGNTDDNNSLNYFSSEDYRDLQMWYNLAWIGVESRKRPELEKLFRKGRGFSEADKKILFGSIKEILSQIVPELKKLWESDQIELSTSPYYHPILPLLCDNYIAKESSPYISLPRSHFQYPDDAEEQVEKGLQYFEKLFGRRPEGMWPSEGSVSMEALEIIARQGINWAATDEGILANTLKSKYAQHKIYQPYLLNTGKNSLNLFFRDHYLSDAIGFVYSNWPYEQAVSDFMNRLHAIRKLIVEKYGEKDISKFVIPIILDGENCWEYYDSDGKPFLRELYEAISEDHLIESVTFGDMLKRNKHPEKLTSLYPGSWINSNFNIWIGAEEDNRSWDVLYQTREFLVARQNEGMHSEETIKSAWEKIYIAEGSDWNWWYGEEHSSENDMEFDSLYREHLMEVYRLLDHDIPAALYQTIKKRHFDRFESTMPKNFIHPVLDGKSSNFYEWVGAAVYDIQNSVQSSMHQVTRIADKIYVGFNAENLYLRLDFFNKPDPMLDFVLAIKRPRTITVVLTPLRGIMEKYEMEDGIQKKTNLKPDFKMNKILEMGIPFKELEIKAGDIIGFQMLIKQAGKLLEEFPNMNLIELQVPDKDFDLIEWSV